MASEDTSDNTGKVLQLLRLQRGLTQKGLADLIGGDQATISRFENGLSSMDLDLAGALEDADIGSADVWLRIAREYKKGSEVEPYAYLAELEAVETVPDFASTSLDERMDWVEIAKQFDPMLQQKNGSVSVLEFAKESLDPMGYFPRLGFVFNSKTSEFLPFTRPVALKPGESRRFRSFETFNFDGHYRAVFERQELSGERRLELRAQQQLSPWHRGRHEVVITNTGPEDCVMEPFEKPVLLSFWRLAKPASSKTDLLDLYSQVNQAPKVIDMKAKKNTPRS